MKKKIEHFKYISICSDHLTTNENVKVVALLEPWQNNGIERVLYEFWIPATSLVKQGRAIFLPDAIIRARCKHHGFTFDHWTHSYIKE